jgi:hypothetical protein
MLRQTTCRFRMVNATGGQRVKTSYLLRTRLANNERSGSARLDFLNLSVLAIHRGLSLH